MQLKSLLQTTLVLALMLPVFHTHVDAEAMGEQYECAVCLHVADDDSIVNHPQVEKPVDQYSVSFVVSGSYTANTLLQQRARAPPQTQRLMFS